MVDLAAYVARACCPTLLLRGGRSDYLQPAMVERMRALNPRIEAVEIADAGHYIHDDQPAAFARHVCRFLKPHAPAGA